MQATLNYIKESLAGLYSPNEITFLTQIVIENVTDLSIPMIISDKNRKITINQQKRIEEIIERLKKSEPIQYILGEAQFFDLKFKVNKDVLIPRPETEELVELIIEDNQDNRAVKILDIGTGSGCIAISLAKYLNNLTVSAWDVSESALIVAAENACTNNVNVDFQKVDVLGCIPAQQKYDLIVSNPPYVLDSEKRAMDNNVLRYEPHLALFVEDNEALIFYERIASIAQGLLNKGGRLYFEINEQKGQETVNMLEDKGFSKVSIKKDISGKDRIVTAIFK